MQCVARAGRPKSHAKIKKKHLLERGQKFREMRDSHHVYYQGSAFFQERDRLIRIHVRFRIMIDAGLFRKSNPSYPRLFTKKSDRIDLILWSSSSTDQPNSERVQSSLTDIWANGIPCTNVENVPERRKKYFKDQSSTLESLPHR